MLNKQYLKDLVYQVNGAAIEVHKHIGPGLLESVYHKCMVKELAIRGINVQSEVTMGLLINFNVTNIFKEGQKSYVNERYRYLEE